MSKQNGNVDSDGKGIQTVKELTDPSKWVSICISLLGRFVRREREAYVTQN